MVHIYRALHCKDFRNSDIYIPSCGMKCVIMEPLTTITHRHPGSAIGQSRVLCEVVTLYDAVQSICIT